MGVLGVGNLVENPRLAEGGDDKPPRRRSLEGVQNGRDVLGEDLAPLRAGTSSCFVKNVVESLVELLEADSVGVLVPDEALHPPKNAEVEGLGEVGGVGDKKRHCDVFSLEQTTVLLLFVTRAAIKH